MKMLTIRKGTNDRVFVESSTGERWCEVLGGVGVDCERRGRFIAQAIRLMDAAESVLGRTHYIDTGKVD